MSTYPAIYAGQRITANLLTQMLPLWAVKAGSTSRSATTTLADDADLILPLPRAGTWAFEAWLNYTGGTLGASDLKLSMAYSAASSFGAWGLNGITTASTSQLNAGGNALSASLSLGTNGGFFLTADIKGTLVATATGTLSLQWAQNTSNATATTLRQGCWIRAYQIS